MTRGLNIVGSSRNNNQKREQNDYYATDPKAIKDLSNFVDISGVVWENACGEGNLSKELEKIDNVEKVISTDLIDRGYGDQLDFMSFKGQIKDLFQEDKKENISKIDWIITNPPYKYGKDWVMKSLKYSDNVAMLMKLVFLESVNRYDFFKNSGLYKVLVYSKRLGVYKNNIKTKNSGLVAYAWFVFKKGYTGKPTIDWIL